MSEILEPPKKKRRTLLGALRTYFLTGLVVTAPIYITFYLMLWFVEFLDGYFRPWIPEIYWPTTYLPFDMPGVGVVLAFVLLTFIGGLTANFLGRGLLALADRLIRQIPMAGTFTRRCGKSFKPPFAKTVPASAKWR